MASIDHVATLHNWLDWQENNITLLWSIHHTKCYSGVILALYGREPDDDRGRFHVEEYCFQDLPVQKDRPVLEEDRYEKNMYFIKSLLNSL